MGIHQHIQTQPRRGELGGTFQSTLGERLSFIEIQQGCGHHPRKIKTKKGKRAKQDERVVIVFHDVAKSQDVHLTPSQLKRKVDHYKAEGKDTHHLESALRQANRFRFRRS